MAALALLIVAWTTGGTALGDVGQAGVETGVVIAEPSPSTSTAGILPLSIAATAATALFLVLRGWRLPREPSPEPLATLHLAALAGAMLLMGPLGAVVAMAVSGVGTPTGTDQEPVDELRRQGIVMFGAYGGQAIVALAWLVMRRSVPRGDPPPHTDSRLRAVGVGVLTFAIAWPIVAAVVAIAGVVRLSVTGEPTDQLAHETLKALDVGGGTWRIVVMLQVALAAPLLEEICFRGLMQPALRKVGAGPWTAIVLISGLFTVVHWGVVPPPALAGLFIVGVAFGWARERTGGLTAPIVAHALFNIGNLMLAGML